MLNLLLVGGILILLLVKKLFDKRTVATTNVNGEAASCATQGVDSSSLSFPTSGSDYEVFLSFRGEDTRKNFTDHLYNALVQRGIHTFRDNQELRIGEKIDPVLRSAIHQSKIAIPIFSERYGSSKWCLRELAEIVKCMKQEESQRQITVMPVFYHVDPSDVRNQTGSYNKAFREHEKKFGQETEGWKKALKVVGELKGWDLDNIADGHEGELIKLIVKEVWTELKKSPLIVSEDLVGIHSHVEEVMKLLNFGSNDVRIAGIHGLGGIGKTTIARCVYKAVYHHFDGCSFIADVRETFQMRGLIHLQSQLIINILNLENPNITSIDHGIHVIRERLSNKKVLIVLDDVDQNTDLNAIIGKHGWFGYGSRIIITTRDKHILDVHEVDGTYEPKEMDLHQSLKLFSKHAFKKDQPPKHYLDLSKDVVKTTGGLPLALEVVGSSLFGTKESSVWKEMAMKLRNIPNDEVQKKLKISYDGLDCVQKEMFLDIACFFIGMDKNKACYIWNGSNLFPQTGIEVLRQKSLVKIGEYNQLRMHDQLRDLGREIVRQENLKNPGKRSRLWSQQEVLDVLSSQTGTRKVEGLCIDFNGQYGQSLMSEGFARMTNLKLLQLDYAVVSGSFMYSFSELRWLSWKGCRSIEFTPTNPKKLVVLDLSDGDITESWMGWSYIKMAKTLKVLDLTGSNKLFQTPNFSTNLQLEELILQRCINLAAIDVSIGHLKNLVVFNMEGCKSLKHLPTSICELKSLQRLNIRSTIISQLPENLGNLEALMELLIDGTSIKQLPNSIGHLRNLRTLSAGGCNIQEGGIPDVIGRITSLEFLSFDGNKFHSLPETVSSLSLLQTLTLTGCRKLQSLPSLSNLKNLKVLWLDKCENLVEIPITINALTRLKSLSISGCHALQYIPHLPSGLTSLIVDRCENVIEISAFSDMRNLETLRLDSCTNLAKIESLEGLDSLQKLEISYCSSLSKLPKLGGLKKLRLLQFYNVDLFEIEGLEGLYSLEELSIVSCTSLRKILNLSHLKNLVSIRIGWFFELSAIQGLEALDSLEQLYLIRCESLTKIQLPKNLRKLCINTCESVSEIEGLEDLKSLEVLQVIRCKSVEILPDLSNLTKLRILHVKGCKKLIEIQGVERLEILEVLYINGCVSIKTLPCLSKLKKLKILSVVDCMKLTVIQGVGELESLEELHIDNCISLEVLPCLSNLKKLKTLSAVECMKLNEIQGADGLESLEELNVHWCISMTLPDLSILRKLRKFVGPFY